MKPARTNPVRLFSGLRSYRSPRNAQFSKHMLRSSSPLGLLRNISQSSLNAIEIFLLGAEGRERLGYFDIIHQSADALE